MAKRRERGAGTVGKGVVVVVVSSVVVGLSVLVGSSGLLLVSLSLGGFCSVPFVKLKDDKPWASRDAIRGSGGGTRSQRAWVGCMILGYCMELVWMS